MKRSVLFIFLLGALAACVQASEHSTKRVLLIGFKEHVSEQEASEVLDRIFEDGGSIQRERLFQDPRPLEAIREKYPDRTLRSAASQPAKAPLVYKITVEMSEEDIESLIASLNNWQELEFIQKDYRVQTHE